MFKVKTIACIGNMNNMMMPIALYLRDIGYDVTLFLLNEYSHFHPQADTDEELNLNILSLGWSDENFSNISRKEIRKVLKPFDFLIGTDYAAAFCYKGGICLDIYFPAGTDLSDWAFRKSDRIIPYRWEFPIISCAKAQFYGIKYAKHISIDATNSFFEEKVKVIRKNTNSIEYLPYHYLPFFEEKKSTLNNPYKNLYDKINLYEFKIIQHCRQEWKCPETSIHLKGNDRLIHAYKDFLEKNININCVLVLLEYGTDVEATKDLINELDLQNKVIWLPKMDRKYLIQFIKISDIGIGIFGRSWFSYCALYEYMMSKVPIITFRDDVYFIDKGLELYSIYNANSIIEISEALNSAYNNKEKRNQIVSESYQWFIKKHQFRIDTVINLVSEKRKKHQLLDTFKTLPLYKTRLYFLKILAFVIEFISIRIIKRYLKTVTN